MAIRYQLMDIQVSFHFLAIMNKAVSICIQDFLWTLCFHFSWSGREWGHMVTVFHIFFGTSRLFTNVVAAFCMSASSVCKFKFLHILAIVFLLEPS